MWHGAGVQIFQQKHTWCNAGSPSSGPRHLCLLALGAVEAAGVLLGEGERRFGPRLQEELGASSTCGPCSRRGVSFSGSDCPQARSFSVPSSRLRVLTGRGGGGGFNEDQPGKQRRQGTRSSSASPDGQPGPCLEFPALLTYSFCSGFPSGASGKNPPASVGDTADVGRSLGQEGPLQ